MSDEHAPRDARDHLHDPHPPRTPLEQRQDDETKELDEKFKTFGTEEKPS